jgi:hypothetical protein
VQIFRDGDEVPEVAQLDSLDHILGISNGVAQYIGHSVSRMPICREGRATAGPVTTCARESI